MYVLVCLQCAGIGSEPPGIRQKGRALLLFPPPWPHPGLSAALASATTLWPAAPGHGLWQKEALLHVVLKRRDPSFLLVRLAQCDTVTSPFVSSCSHLGKEESRLELFLIKGWMIIRLCKRRLPAMLD